MNLALYAYDSGSPSHMEAKAWWEETLSGVEPVRIAWVTILGFMRIATHPRVFARPMSVDEACRHVETWLDQSVVEVIEPGPRHWSTLSTLLRTTSAAGNLTTDAHLAALAIDHGATLCSADQDFGRFPGLRFVNPLRAR